MSIRERKGKKGVSYQVYFPYKNELGVTCTYRKGGFKTKREAKTHETLVILSILVDTFISKISLPMQPVPEIGSISVA